ncbi:hypothetical protein FRC11_011354, partial [Ceratobasidium sp. 423]
MGETNMGQLMAARSFNEDSQNPQLSGKQVFKVMFVMIFEYFVRFKDASTINPDICGFTEQMARWFDEWVAALGSNPPFQDECTAFDEEKREFIIENLRRDKDRVLRLIRRGQKVVIADGEARESFEPPSDSKPGLIAALERVFAREGPGEFCETGPRHDNDHADIEMINEAPTGDELLCEADPYLPANFFEAPHFYDPRSIERLLDIQFRLLREELMAPIRLAVHLIIEDLKKLKSGTTPLSKLLDSRGGRYAAPATAQEYIIFSVYTGISFQPLELSNRGMYVGIGFDAPPGRARHEQSGVRANYWEQVSNRRLMQDGLIILIWKTPKGKVDIYVGTVASSAHDLVECAKTEGGRHRVSIRVSFFDAKANIRIVKTLQNQHDSNDICVLIEAPVFYEGIRPFLEALKRDPESFQFARYLSLQSQEELSRIIIDPPLYSRIPGFSFELKYLFPPEAGIESLRLTSQDPDSVANARAQLIRASRLDPGQAEAVVDSLTREVALVQGPPGTGKSHTGLELIRVFVTNGVSPILLVAPTDHALDHMLNGILDAGITDNIIRLGSSLAMDDRLSPYSLEAVESKQDKSELGHAGKSARAEMKILESQMKALMDDVESHNAPSSHIEEHTSYMYPHHHEEFFQHVPAWIDAIAPKHSDAEESWETVGELPNQPEEQSIINFWLKGYDLAFLETWGQEDATAEASVQISSFNSPNTPLNSDIGGEPTAATRQTFLCEFMRSHGIKDIPKVPRTTRPLSVLLKNPGVWCMSQSERIALHDAWSNEANDLAHASQIRQFEILRRTHEKVLSWYKEITDRTKAEILACSHVVGYATTNAARALSLLSAMGPRVVMVEEAGQVLEAHVLANLVGTVEHLVLLGDPLKLRPNINSYKLSTDNPRTGIIYRFDQSLMDRLTSSGFPMSQIDVQRRMRPEISSLIRNTLYPKLKDNERVLRYPNVRGMYKNMYFVSHSHKEVDGWEDAVSKHNPFEASIDMIHDLVLHLFKQGCYNKPRNIVILAAYLGQIPKLCKKLQDIATIVIDERDAALLAKPGPGKNKLANTCQTNTSRRVLVRTLDTFQGEEGDIVILSLVRNSGTRFDGEMSSLQVTGGRSPIGFLRSVNRINVALSRAKHGLYIFGNAPELAGGSLMWAHVLQELHLSGCVGRGFLIKCHKHPGYAQWIEQPGQLGVVAPD